MSNTCNKCKYFSKYRGLEFGPCNNDNLFQYADNKEDLASIDPDNLIIMGEAIPVVGIKYFCDLVFYFH